VPQRTAVGKLFSFELPIPEHHKRRRDAHCRNSVFSVRSYYGVGEVAIVSGVSNWAPGAFVLTRAWAASYTPERKGGSG